MSVINNINLKYDDLIIVPTMVVTGSTGYRLNLPGPAGQGRTGDSARHG